MKKSVLFGLLSVLVLPVLAGCGEENTPRAYVETVLKARDDSFNPAYCATIQGDGYYNVGSIPDIKYGIDKKLCSVDSWGVQVDDGNITNFTLSSKDKDDFTILDSQAGSRIKYYLTVSLLGSGSSIIGYSFKFDGIYERKYDTQEGGYTTSKLDFTNDTRYKDYSFVKAVNSEPPEVKKLSSIQTDAITISDFTTNISYSKYLMGGGSTAGLYNTDYIYKSDSGKIVLSKLQWQLGELTEDDGCKYRDIAKDIDMYAKPTSADFENLGNNTCLRAIYYDTSKFNNTATTVYDGIQDVTNTLINGKIGLKPDKYFDYLLDVSNGEIASYFGELDGQQATTLDRYKEAYIVKNDVINYYRCDKFDDMKTCIGIPYDEDDAKELGSKMYTWKEFFDGLKNVEGNDHTISMSIDGDSRIVYTINKDTPEERTYKIGYGFTPSLTTGKLIFTVTSIESGGKTYGVSKVQNLPAYTTNLNNLGIDKYYKDNIEFASGLDGLKEAFDSDKRSYVLPTDQPLADSLRTRIYEIVNKKGLKDSYYNNYLTVTKDGESYTVDIDLNNTHNAVKAKFNDIVNNSYVRLDNALLSIKNAPTSLTPSPKVEEILMYLFNTLGSDDWSELTINNYYAEMTGGALSRLKMSFTINDNNLELGWTNTNNRYTMSYADKDYTLGVLGKTFVENERIESISYTDERRNATDTITIGYENNEDEFQTPKRGEGGKLSSVVGRSTLGETDLGSLPEAYYTYLVDIANELLADGYELYKTTLDDKEVYIIEVNNKAYIITKDQNGRYLLDGEYKIVFAKK